MLKEFKEFVMKGNVVGLAIAVIIGVAFGKVITSLVTDVIMPPIGLLLGKVDFSNLFINLSGEQFTKLADAKAAGAATINYGLFVNAVIDFVIVAFVIFLIVRSITRVSRQEVTTKECPFCLSTIPLKATKCSQCTSELG